MTPFNVLLFVWVGFAGLLAMTLTGFAWLFIFSAMAANMSWRAASRVVARLSRSQGKLAPALLDRS